MFSVTRPMMGVWMDEESTVIMVSQGINRPKGANTGLDLLGTGTPAVLSANRLMGVNNSVGRGCGAGNEGGGTLVKPLAGLKRAAEGCTDDAFSVLAAGG